MTDKNGAAFPSPDDNSNHRHIERVVDELRMVLSDLGRSKPAPPEPQPEPPAPEQKETPSSFVSNGFETIKPEPVSSNPVASDAEFWNGNVLGWSEEPAPLDEPRAELPVEGLPSGLNENPLDDENFEDLRSPLPSSKVNLALSEFDNEPANGGLWGMEEPPLGSPELPPAPEPPMVFEPPKEAPLPPEPMSVNPFSPTFAPFTEEPPMEEVPREEKPKSIVVPIPQTVEQKPESTKPADPNLNLESPDLKPKGFVQIACIFPEGQEKLGQAFVTKLKETGEKSKKVVNIQAVFVHPWSSDKIDIAAWKKSAVLSGADTMFILVSKANAASLKAVGNGPMNEIKSRIVFLEHIPMKTLYADIIVDFQRGK
jgi:hypothetical protein